MPKKPKSSVKSKGGKDKRVPSLVPVLGVDVNHFPGTVSIPRLLFEQAVDKLLAEKANAAKRAAAARERGRKK